MTRTVALTMTAEGPWFVPMVDVLGPMAVHRTMTAEALLFVPMEPANDRAADKVAAGKVAAGKEVAVISVAPMRPEWK